MAENKVINTNIDNAIKLWKGVIGYEFEYYFELIDAIFKRCYKFYKSEDIDFEDLITCAFNKKDYIYLKDFSIKNRFSYDSSKSIHENLKIWGEKTHITNSDAIIVSLCDISQVTGKKLWEELRKDCNFDKDEQIKAYFETSHQHKTKEFYEYIIKSILHAEYLFLSDYSQKLKEAVEEFLPDVDEKNKRFEIGKKHQLNLYPIKGISKPNFILKFPYIASQLQDMCWRIKNAVDNGKKRRLNLDFLLNELIEKKIKLAKLSEESFQIYKDTEYFHFTQSVIELTSIDHIHKASIENIGKLITLWNRCFDDVLDLEPNIISIVKAKTAAMLHKMVFDIGDEESRKLLNLDNVDFFYSMGGVNEEYIKKEVERANLMMMDNNNTLNPIIKTKIENKNKRISSEIFLPEPEKTSFTDIEVYNLWIKKCQDNYYEISGLIEKIHNCNKEYQMTDVLDIINCINSFVEKVENEKDTSSEHYSPYLFLLVLNFIRKVIEEINNNIINNNQDDVGRLRGKLSVLLHKILLSLKRYVTTYKERMPPLFRPFFQHSFYVYDSKNNKFEYYENNNIDTYDCDQYENKFFFASYYCNPVSISRLNDIYEEYSLLLQFISLDFALEVKNLENQLEDNIKNTKNEIKEQLRQSKEYQDKEIRNTQRSSLQTLGLFTGFLAFIVTSIGTFRVATNISEYIIYSLTYTLAIALFAFLISSRPGKLTLNDGEKNGTKKERRKAYLTKVWDTFISNGKTLLFGLIFIMLLVFIIIYFCFIYSSSKETKDTTNEISTTNKFSVSFDNTSTPRTINFQDINQNDTTMKPVYVENSNDNSNIQKAMSNMKDITQNDTTSKNSLIEPINAENSNSNNHSSNTSNNANQE